MTTVPLTTHPEALHNRTVPIGQAGVTFKASRHHFDLPTAIDLKAVVAGADRR